ncbi:MAG: phospholipase D family protein, partial [Casimicrobium sp.]
QPTLRGTCRIILSTTFLGTPTNPWNDAAANELAAAGWIVRRFAADPILHAKIWNIGNRWAYVGSHNLTVHATTANREAGIVTNSPSIVADVSQYFESLWNVAT